MLLHMVFALGLSMYIYYIAPKVSIDPQPINVSEEMIPPPENVIVISWNNEDKRFQDKLRGPESFTHNPDNGEIYTGTSDGRIWRINKEMTEASPVIRIGEEHPDCGSDHVGHICGRALGLKFLAPDKLIVADAYKGIIAIHLEEVNKQVLIQPEENMETRSLKLFNSVDVSTDGIIYFTVSSTKWALHDVVYLPLEGDRTGRVYSYDLQTQKLKIISKNLFFPNGLTLSHDGKSLLVCELLKRRILKFNLLNLNKEPQIWIENLHGFPNHIKRMGEDNYYLSLPIFGFKDMHSWLNKYPLMNYLAAWLVPKWILSCEDAFISQIYKINEQGDVVSIINGTYLQKSLVTEAYQVGDKILFGSLHKHYVAVMDLE